MKNHVLISNLLLLTNFLENFDMIFGSSCFSINEPWEKISRFLGRSWSAPLKFMGESTTFAKKAIEGFCGPKGG